MDPNIALQAVSVSVPAVFLDFVVAVSVLLIGAAAAILIYKALDTFIASAAVDDLESDYHRVKALERYTREQDVLLAKEESGLQK